MFCVTKFWKKHRNFFFFFFFFEVTTYKLEIVRNQFSGFEY